MKLGSNRPTFAGFFHPSDQFSGDCHPWADLQQHGRRDWGHDRRPADGPHSQLGLWFGGQ